jgi:ectoine hydroxylase-related dioxygenase (phytanoyl-CoA dioxygenase family)
MVAAWFALEDIEKDAGRFFVIPKSHKLALPSYDSLKSHEKYIEIVSKSIEVNSLERYAPDLKKGDVLFWHSKTIHGAFSQKNTKFSRKSVTAHYHPTGFARDKSREVDDVKIILNKLIKTKNPNMYLDNYDPSIINFMYVRYYKEIIKSFVKRGGGTVMSRKDGL